MANQFQAARKAKQPIKIFRQPEKSSLNAQNNNIASTRKHPLCFCSHTTPNFSSTIEQTIKADTPSTFIRFAHTTPFVD